MSDLSPDAGRRIYRMLCFMAWCDGDLAAAEREVLERYRDDLGLTEVDAAALEAQGSEVEGLELGEEPEELAVLVDALIDIAVADGKLVLDEQARLTRLAKMIKAPNLVGRMADRIKERKVDLEIQRWEDGAKPS